MTKLAGLCLSEYSQAQNKDLWLSPVCEMHGLTSWTHVQGILTARGLVIYVFVLLTGSWPYSEA